MTIPTNFRPMLACDYRKVITKPASVLYSEKLRSGFTFEERIMLWKIRDTLLGKYAKIKYTSYSYKNVPLQPIFICFRNKIDM